MGDGEEITERNAQEDRQEGKKGGTQREIGMAESLLLL